MEAFVTLHERSALQVYIAEQFLTRLANMYFLLLIILQTVPAVTITSGYPATLPGLALVLAFDGEYCYLPSLRCAPSPSPAVQPSAAALLHLDHVPHLCTAGLVTAREDYLRHTDDQRTNQRMVLVRRQGCFTKVMWEDVLVGDILKIPGRGQVPADCLLLAAQQHDGHISDTCYVQTMQLDGETNLKLKRAVQDVVQRCTAERHVLRFRRALHCEAPNSSFTRFIASIQPHEQVGMHQVSNLPTSPISSPEISDGDIALTGLSANKTPAALDGATATATASSHPNGQDDWIPLDAEQLLLRGCEIRSVQCVYAAVVYTGRDCKVMVGSPEPARKAAQVEAATNKIVGLVAAALVILCAIGTIGFAEFTRTNHPWYLRYPNTAPGEPRSVSSEDVSAKLGTFFLLSAGFVPITLFTTMRLVRVLQTHFISQDEKLVHVQRATRPGEEDAVIKPRVRSMELNDDLGQITHVLSDKTGTLTQNYMEFRKFAVGGISYGLGNTTIGLSRLRRQGQRQAAARAQVAIEEDENSPRTTAHVNFRDGSDSHPGRTLLSDSQPAKGSPEIETTAGNWGLHEAIHEFMLHLALNHTVLVEETVDSNTGQVQRSMSASSPDEEAFVFAAQHFGYTMHNRSQAHIELQVPPAGGLLVPVPGAPRPSRPRQFPTLRFDILHMLPYTQQRKRMSVIVKHPDGRVTLYCKGADDVIYARLRKSQSATERDMVEQTAVMMSEWGSDGHRTLCFAHRDLDADEVEDFGSAFTQAFADLEQVRAWREHDKGNVIDRLMDTVEQDLVLQGATANEDKLQHGVPETIELLEEANIAVHMLTGDKEETAVNIAFATRLVDTKCELIFATNGHSNDAGTLRGIAALRVEAKRRRSAEPADLKPLVLVVDDVTLQHIADETAFKAAAESSLAAQDEAAESSLLQDFQELLMQARALIACRCRPDQKAMLVQLLRSWDKTARVLAIGDGANDVDMIQSAHVGVGIAGKEGSQAVNACDFAVGQFSHLQRLLLVHGRWNYSRMSLLVSYQLYKSIINTMVQYYFSASTGWSGQKWYVEVFSQIFGLLIVQFPILMLAVLDRDVSAEASLIFPELYSAGQRGKLLNLFTFAGWLMTALIESAVVYFFTITATNTLGGETGATPYIFQVGFIAFCAMVLVCTIRICSMMNLHFWFFQVITAVFVLIIIPVSMLLGALSGDNLNSSGYQHIAESPSAWLLCLLLPVLVQLPWHVKVNYQRIWKPTLSMLVSEVEAWGFRKLSSRELRKINEGAAAAGLGHGDVEMHHDGYVLSTADGSDDGSISPEPEQPTSAMKPVFNMLAGTRNRSSAANQARQAAAITALRSGVNKVKGQVADHGTLTAAGGNLWSLFASQMQQGTHSVGQALHHQRVFLEELASSMSSSLADSWHTVLAAFDNDEAERPPTRAGPSDVPDSSSGDRPGFVPPPISTGSTVQSARARLAISVPSPSSSKMRRARSFQDILAGGAAGIEEAGEILGDDDQANEAQGGAAAGTPGRQGSEGNWHMVGRSLFSQDPDASAWVAEKYSTSGRAASARHAQARQPAEESD